MLQFTTSIPALYNSPQLKDFFRVRHTRTQKLCQVNISYVIRPVFLSVAHILSFNQGGEATRPLDPSTLSSAGPLPPPLIPLPKRRASDCEPAEEEEGREAPTLPQDLGNNLSLEVGEPEVAAEAYSEIGGSPTEEEHEELSDVELDDRGGNVRMMPYCFLQFFKNSHPCFTFLVLAFPSSPVSIHKPRLKGDPGRI